MHVELKASGDQVLPLVHRKFHMEHNKSEYCDITSLFLCTRLALVSYLRDNPMLKRCEGQQYNDHNILLALHSDSCG